MNHDQLPPTPPPGDALDYEHLILRLRDLNEEMFGQNDGVIERISQEITQWSQGSLSVRWHQPGATPPRSGPLSPLPSAPVQYAGRYYGELVSAVDPAQPALPLVPAEKAQVVANMCGWLIYSLEVAALLGNQHVPFQQFEPLTRRERQVLVLMSQNCDARTIADLLRITPATVKKHRESIYRRLGVNTVPHAVLTGFLMVHYSPTGLSHPSCGPSLEGARGSAKKNRERSMKYFSPGQFCYLAKTTLRGE